MFVYVFSLRHRLIRRLHRQNRSLHHLLPNFSLHHLLVRSCLHHSAGKRNKRIQYSSPLGEPTAKLRSEGLIHICPSYFIASNKSHINVNALLSGQRHKVVGLFSILTLLRFCQIFPITHKLETPGWNRNWKSTRSRLKETLENQEMAAIHYHTQGKRKEFVLIHENSLKLSTQIWIKFYHSVSFPFHWIILRQPKLLTSQVVQLAYSHWHIVKLLVSQF